jgi:hypothetical protein
MSIKNSKQVILSLLEPLDNFLENSSSEIVRVELYLHGDRPKLISIIGDSYETFIQPAMIRYSQLFTQVLSRHIDVMMSPDSLTKDLLENINFDLDQNYQCQSDLGLPICQSQEVSTLIGLYITSKSTNFKDPMLWNRRLES